MVERSDVAQAVVPGQRTDHGPERFVVRLAAALTRLRPEFDPDPASRACSRARVAAYLQAQQS